MTSRNDITGDSLTTGVASDAFRDGYDRIFGNKKRNTDPAPVAEVTGEEEEAFSDLEKKQND